MIVGLNILLKCNKNVFLMLWMAKMLFAKQYQEWARLQSLYYQLFIN